MDLKVTELLSLIHVEYKFIFSILISSDGNVIERFGSPEQLKWSGLPKSLFGDLDARLRLISYLEGRELPDFWGQGEVSGILLKPTPETIFGLFKEKDADLPKEIEIGAEIKTRLESSFGSSLAGPG